MPRTRSAAPSLRSWSDSSRRRRRRDLPRDAREAGMSRDRETPTGASPIESVDELVAHLRTGEKPPERWRVGTEHEKIGLYEDTHQPVPYEGERGIGALLRRIAEEDGW